jgi:hypothetical protein
LWLAWEQPVLFFIALAFALILAIVLIVALFKFVRAMLRRLRGRAAVAGA